MCYSQKVGKIVEKLKFQWLILDEISASGNLGAIGYNHAYLTSKSGLQIVFRNRIVSDYLAFHSRLNKPSDFWQAVRRDGRSHQVLITAMDGENLGHHRPGLNRLWEKLVTRAGVKTMTLSGLLVHYQQEKLIQPQPASWSSREVELKHDNPYGLWHDPANPIHYWQWQLINKVIKHISANKKGKKYQRARVLLDQQLASDQFWWASAKPWWSLDIIEKKTSELIHTACLVDGNRQLKRIEEKIIGLARTWQREQKFQTIARNYLAAEARDGVRFLGGKKITSH
jgi:alpha-amylase/alpha-mannosidase (GH57 family)